MICSCVQNRENFCFYVTIGSMVSFFLSMIGCAIGFQFLDSASSSFEKERSLMVLAGAASLCFFSTMTFLGTRIHNRQLEKN